MGSVPEQFDVMVNTNCNARCPFCVQETTWKALMEKQWPFIEGVRKHVKDYHDLGGRKVVITGGEPTLVPGRVIPVLETLAEREWDLVYMYTNGSRLLNDYEGGTLAQKLMESGLQAIDLSRHHYNSEANNKIFGMDVGETRDIARHLNEIGMPLRLCATLQKGGLENADDIMNYIDFAQEVGAKDVYFREMFRIHNVDESNPKVKGHLRYIEDNFVPIEPIIDELGARGLIQTGQRANFQGRKKNELSFKTPNGFQFYTAQLEIGKEQADQFPYLVVMPNGKLYSTWMGEEYEVPDLKEALAV